MTSIRSVRTTLAAALVTAGLFAVAQAQIPVNSPFCDGSGTNTVPCPCGNSSPADEGCTNSTTQGAKLVLTGSTSVSVGTATLTTTQMPLNKLGFTYYGPNPWGGNPFGTQHSDGIRCLLAGGTSRMPNQNTGGSGSFSYTDLWGTYNLPIQGGETWYFQSYYRDAQGPCGTGANFSNGWKTTFVN